MKKLRGNLMLLLTALIWGSAFVAQTVGMDHVGPFTFNCVRMFLGALVLLPVIAWREEHNPANKKAHGLPENGSGRVLAAGGISCGVMLFLGSSLQQCGLQYTTPGKAGFITALYIVIVPIAGLFLKKKAPRSIWISVPLAVVGLYCLCVTETSALTVGDFYLLLCAFCFSAHIMVIDYFTQKVDGVYLSCMQFLVVTILSGIGMFALESPSLAALQSCTGAVLYAGLLSSGLGYTFQILAQKDSNPMVVSLLLSLESVFATLAGVVILHDQMSGREYLGCALMLGAVVLAQLPDRKKQPA